MTLSTDDDVAATQTTALSGLLRGHVQGIGVRPAIANLASRCALTGRVSNVAGGVAIVIEGSRSQVADFQRLLRSALPREAIVEDCEWAAVPAAGMDEFSILECVTQGPLAALIPRDRAVCGECLRDTFTDSDRRRSYAFTGCTRCGPRYSIIEAMPYERAATTMRLFAQCSCCLREYTNPDDRRFHAQTNACRQCGPRLRSADRQGQEVNTSDDVVLAAASVIRQGGILALRGIGGYQLVCDATQSDAVRRLRVSKQRPDKPFAVMLSNADVLAQFTHPSSTERRALLDAANPIVVLAEHRLPLSPEVTRGLKSVGVMLPTTPLHAILTAACGVPLVVTSGNIDGNPLAVEPADAERDLASIADHLIHHDRAIVHPIDDSVVRVMSGRPVSLRAARGLVPLPLSIKDPIPGLAVGGHQKLALAVSNGVQAALGPHLGDLDSVPMRRRFEEHVAELLALYGARPEFVVGDQHPDYFTSRWLQQFTVPSLVVTEAGVRRIDCPCFAADPPNLVQRGHSALAGVRHVVRVQHHHAHIAAGMVEHGWHDREVLGVAFDGTGHGPDETIWGGEILRCTLGSFRRVGRLRPFQLPGGERAIREPWRIALALLKETLPPDELEATLSLVRPPGADWQSLLQLTSNHRLSPATSSAGRLLDGIAALVLPMAQATYEGQPAVQLEDCCDLSEPGLYEIPIRESQILELDWRPAVRQVVVDLRAGVSPGRIAMKFHRGLATTVGLICDRFTSLPIILGGGVFQNRILVEQIADLVPVSRLGLPGQIPPNDGGLAAGQLAIANSVLSTFPRTSP